MQNNLPLVSILIPVFNREQYISETIQSAISQTYSNIEIVIVDNNSTDNTWQIMKDCSLKDARVKIFRNKQNVGPVRNWLRCIEEARGQYGKILWSDDLIATDFIEKSILMFEEHNEIAFVFSKAEIFSVNTKRNRTVFNFGKTGIYKSSEYIDGILLYDGLLPVSPGCAIFRINDLRENLLEQIPNTINSDFSMHAIGNDLLLFLLTANRYNSFGFVNETLSFFREHSSSITISSPKAKLIVMYEISKIYFISQHRNNRPYIRKFSATLLLKWILFIRNNDLGISEINSLFPCGMWHGINYLFFLAYAAKKALQKIKTFVF